jgi:hypothetical protein
LCMLSCLLHVSCCPVPTCRIACVPLGVFANHFGGHCIHMDFKLY